VVLVAPGVGVEPKLNENGEDAAPEAGVDAAAAVLLPAAGVDDAGLPNENFRGALAGVVVEVEEGAFVVFGVEKLNRGLDSAGLLVLLFDVAPPLKAF
jgi:hypothetical protein